MSFCGTSSATPVVSGIAGLAYSLQPGLTKDTFEQALRSSTVPIRSAVEYGRSTRPGRSRRSEVQAVVEDVQGSALPAD